VVLRVDKTVSENLTVSRNMKGEKIIKIFNKIIIEPSIFFVLELMCRLIGRNIINQIQSCLSWRVKEKKVQATQPFIIITRKKEKFKSFRSMQLRNIFNIVYIITLQLQQFFRFCVEQQVFILNSFALTTLLFI
jgi:hypothetical protein